MAVPHLKGGNIVWTCAKDNIIKENEDCKAIELHGFDYKLYEKEKDGGFQEGLYRYPYLKHIIQLLPGDWVERISKTNEAVGESNCLDKLGEKRRLVRFF